MNSKQPVLFVIGQLLSEHIESIKEKLTDKMKIYFVGTDENELKKFSAGKKLIVNESIRDFYIDDSILFLNQKEFDNLHKAILYLCGDTTSMMVLFAIEDPLALSVTPLFARAADEKEIDPSFIAVKLHKNEDKVTSENLDFFLKNRYRLYLLERAMNDFSLKANEEKSKNELLMIVINSVVKSFKQAELNNL
ncbi:hypothetical protein MASR1M107_23440 [Ignavibacteriales bacterium]